MMEIEIQRKQEENDKYFDKKNIFEKQILDIEAEISELQSQCIKIPEMLKNIEDHITICQ
jgi:septal ring factor EnvC (AmiA/AmiB activator)